MSDNQGVFLFLFFLNFMILKKKNKNNQIYTNKPKFPNFCAERKSVFSQSFITQFSQIWL
jgi:hypothetical protein